MAKHQINSILGGISPLYHNNPENTYLGACAIDVDEEILNRISGAINPVAYNNSISSLYNVNWFEPNDKNDDKYFYTNMGDFGKIDSDDQVEIIKSFDNSRGNGLSFYNNYYYIATNNNIHRYGPIDDPKLEEFWWTGLSQAEINGVYATNITDYEETAVTGSCAQVIKGLRTRFEDVSIDLKNTGTSAYGINLTIRDIEEGDYTIDDNIKLDVDIDRPTGPALVSGYVDSTALSGSFSLNEFTLNKPFFSTRDFAIELAVDDPGEGKEFTVKTSKGSTRQGTYFIEKNADWGRRIIYDNTKEKITKSGTDMMEMHSWEVSTTQEHLKQDLTIEFNYSHGSLGLYGAAALRVMLNGGGIHKEHATFNRTSGHYGNYLNWTTGEWPYTEIQGNYLIKLHPSLEIKNGDIITIEAYAVSQYGEHGVSNSVDNVSERPYFHFEEERDISLRIETDDVTFLPLQSQTYPAIGGLEIPNHMMFLHSDDAVYFCDTQKGGVVGRIKTGDLLSVVDVTDEGEESDEKFKINDMIRGEQSNASAMIMKITKMEEDDEQGLVLENIAGEFIDGEKVVNIVNTDIYGTVSGDIQRGQANLYSESMALRLPKDIYPVSISNTGTDLMIIGINPGGTSYIFLWDTFADSFYRQIPLPYPIVSAIKTHNGTPYIFGGDDKSHSLNVYRGGDTIEQLFYIDNGLPPLQGAIDTTYDRLKWGSNQRYPEERGCIWAFGSKIIKMGIHNIASAGGQISAIKGKYISSNDGIYQKGGKYNSIWRSELLSFGRPFTLDKITIPLGRNLEANDNLIVTVYYDNEEKSDTFEINNTTYEDRIIRLNPEAQGIHNVFIEVKWDTENQIPINFPIILEYEIYD